MRRTLVALALLFCTSAIHASTVSFSNGTYTFTAQGSEYTALFPFVSQAMTWTGIFGSWEVDISIPAPSSVFLVTQITWDTFYDSPGTVSLFNNGILQNTFAFFPLQGSARLTTSSLNGGSVLSYFQDSQLHEETLTVHPPIAATPEPGTWLLMATGLAMAWRKRCVSWNEPIT